MKVFLHYFIRYVCVKAQKINNIIMFEYKSYFININIIYTSNYIFEHVLY